MNFRISRTSKWSDDPWNEKEDGPHRRTFENLEELIAYVEEKGSCVIDVTYDSEFVESPDFDKTKRPSEHNRRGDYVKIEGSEHVTLEIYDDYRE